MAKTRDDEDPPLTEVRLDVWLDVACLFPTRSQAAAACAGGKVDLNGHAAAAHKLVRARRPAAITFARGKRTFVVKGLAERHVKKAEARALFEETTPPPSAEVLEARRLERLFAPQGRRRRAPDEEGTAAAREGARAGEAPRAPAALRDPPPRRRRPRRVPPQDARAPGPRRRPDASRHAPGLRRVLGAVPPRRRPRPRPPRGPPRDGGAALRASARSSSRAPSSTSPPPRGPRAHVLGLQLAEGRAPAAQTRRPLRPGPLPDRDRAALRREPRAPPPGPVPVPGALAGP